MQRATTPPYEGDTKEEMPSPPVASQSPAASSPHPPTGPTSDWRSLVASSLQKRRQSPVQQRATVERLLARTVAPSPVKLPAVHKAAHQSHARPAGTPKSLRKAMREQFVESKEQLGPQHLNPAALLSSAIARAERAHEAGEDGVEAMRGKRRPRPTAQAWNESSEKEETKEQSTARYELTSPASRSKAITSPNRPSPSLLLPLASSISSSATYTIQPADPSQLYQPVSSKLEQLPLELFDNTEGDLTPSEWIALGKDKYAEAGLPARALRWVGGKWVWEACRVVSWSEDSQCFVIVWVEPPAVEKEVKRLSLLFDDEDANRFAARLAACRELREECLSLRRYTSFVNSQSAALFSPIQPSVLHGIIGKLMTTSESIVMRRQPSVEKLLGEVKEEYNKAMKASIIDYRRKDPVEEAKMEPLRLPPQLAPSPPPHLAVVDTGVHLYAFDALCGVIAQQHYTRHGEATAVVLALYRAWCALSDSVFFDLHFTPRDPPHPSDPVYPMSVHDFVMYQQQHFLTLRERLQNEWRALLINLIRDNLNSVYKLFVNELGEYERGELRRFLTMTGRMLADQLGLLIQHSVLQWTQQVGEYRGVVDEMARRQADSSDVLEGYLDEVSATNLPLSASSAPPLFLFRLTFDAPSSSIVFNPPLPSLLTSLVSLMALPSKLTSLTHIDSDVVPLLGLPERSLIELDNAHLNGLIHAATTLTQSIVQASLVQSAALSARYEPYTTALAGASTLAAGWFSVPRTLEETKAEIGRYRTLMEAIDAASPSVVSFPIVVCDVTGLKEELLTRCEQVVVGLLAGLEAEVRSDYDAMVARWEDMQARLAVQSNNVYEMSEMQQYVDSLQSQAMQRLRDDITHAQDKLDVMLHFQHAVTPTDYQHILSLPRLPLLLTGLIGCVRQQIAADSLTFSSQLQNEQIDLSTQLEQYNMQVDTFSEYGLGTTAQMEQYGAKVELLAEQLDKAERMAETFKQRRALFAGNSSTTASSVTDEYKELTELRGKFTPYFELWSTTSLFNSNHSVWMTGPFAELDADAISRDVTSWIKVMVRLEKLFTNDDIHKPAKVATEVKNKLLDFKQALPAITWLRAPGLRQRHWDRLQVILAPSRQVVLQGEGSELTLSQLLSLNLQGNKAEIEEICNAAEKEYALEVGLDKMQKEWKSLTFTLEAYKATGTYVLKAADEILTVLDEQLMKTQAIKGSPFIKPFENRARKWEARLQLLSAIMEEWLACQKTWMYLEPIFSSEDIMRQMPVEGRRFGVVDSYWRKTMEAARKIGNVLDFVSETEGILKTLQESNKMLDLIGKQLNDYLETKRLAFPRFFFLSNDELLSILSQTKNAQAVQPHLSKCFDAMNALVFKGTAEAPLISGMQSSEAEVVDFLQAIDPNEGAKKGNVELWLKEVEDAMRAALRAAMHRGMQSYTTSKREDWVLQQAGQIVLAVTQTFWTADVTKALNGGRGAMEAQLQSLNAHLDGLVGLVRRSDLSETHRLVLGALTVLDVHARDVVARLLEQNVTSDSEFEWLAQMRYYYEQAEQTAPDATSSNLSIRMINSRLKYGYEYLGIGTRLVITPLTDRCYRTLMAAISLNLGGAPEGPAGTGKTETVKDLAKAVAQQCLVMNCSDALNYKSMAKVFKGLCCSGAWACFDEFNRIDLEVLSVIAQQVSSMQRAISEGRHTFLFEGQSIPLIHTACSFITMNPGYAGRSELPDNLKALFRSVAMMIPDYAMIAEIVLYSYGYSAARLLARKLVACLRLSSEQLSSQDHYDFGMRTVKSILSAAGRMKAERGGSESEERLTVESIKACNEPKFVSEDLPLFHGIVQDLFPSIDQQPSERPTLVSALQQQLSSANLQHPPAFVSKCVELYDTVLVRHGIMLVGKPFAGKSTAIRMLARSVSAMCGADASAAGVAVVDVSYMNPKSVTVDELYGAENAAGEWVQGVVPIVMADMVRDWQADRHWKWIVFDGPVDAVWIENMNTVLDDNKKLCLASGEQIKLCPGMSMMFEVEDLSQASPATVSRCGMVYMEPAGLGVVSLLTSWLAGLRSGPLVGVVDQLQTLCSWLVHPALAWQQQHAHTQLAVSDMHMADSLTKLLSALLANVAAHFDKHPSDARGEQVAVWVECLVMFALVWSVGSHADVASRAQFSTFFHELTTGKCDEAEHAISIAKEHLHRKCQLPFPTADSSATPRSVFDWTYNGTTNSWQYWLADRKEYLIPAGARFQDVIVPTVDTVRNDFLLHTLLTSQTHLLMVGSTGTGKSISAQSKLLHGLDRSVYIPLFLAFSARTTAAATQDLIDSKLERRRVGVMGPPATKRCVIFVDDLNMPQRDTYGAQPPIELLRQWMDYGGWYEKKAKTFRHIVDVQFIAAMGPPGGGRNPITDRLTRHLFVLELLPYDTASLKLIFGTIMRHWMQPLASHVQAMLHPLVDATVAAYTTITKELLPTPAKSHYTFNLRDVAKVFAGIMQVDGDWLREKVDLVRVWAHECTRVFCDRLVDAGDINWFTQLVDLHIGQTFHLDVNSVFSSAQRLAEPTAPRRQIFADFANPKASKRSYVEVKDVDALAAVVESHLHEYNAVNTNSMNLVLFTEAVDHIARISRIIRQPLGNALLVGVGGSGRQSLTRLAAHIADYDFFQVEITKQYSAQEWREDLRSVMRKAGLSNRPIVFLFNEAQATSESFIEDINSILSNGEVPNLFPPEDLTPIIEQILPDARKAGKADNNATIFSYFVDRCRANIHVVLCLSPIGSGFRNRLRQFPSLVNCTTIDWFHPWPAEALRQVATHFLRDVSLEPPVKAGVVDVCVDMQERVNALSADYLLSVKRYNYVTPTSYLELIKLFRQLFESTRQSIKQQESRYQTGLTKLMDTQVQVKAMQQQLTALQPELVRSTKETEELIVTIAARSEQVEATKQLVGEEEKECNKQADEATAIKNDCEEQLKEALPALAMAMNALKVLKKSALDELKAMKVPTAGVVLTIEALCIMMGIQPKMVGSVGAKSADYWTVAKQKLLSDPQLFVKLQTYDKDNIPSETIDKVRPYCRNPDFSPPKIAKASQAAEGFCKWVLAMEVYDRVAKQIEPKRRALDEAEEKLRKASEQLAAKKAQLAEVEALLLDLNTQFALCEKKKASLEFQVKECSERLDRAEKLLGGLSTEKVRWEERVATLSSDYTNVVGNILVASGVIAYLGVFTVPYRDACLKHWLALLASKQIPCDPQFSLARVLGDPMLIRQWGIWTLPKDSFSIDNAIILTKSLRWGLIIDPQEQASRWIRHMEDDKKALKVIKQTDDLFAKTLATAIQLGQPVLIEQVNESLDPLLEPVLLRQTFKQGATTMIRLGSEAIPYHDDFRLYLTSKLPNPHYSPEISTKVTLINMMITPEGLEDQMLSAVVSHEEPELEAERSELIVKNAENARQLQLIENKILEKLNESTGNILDDEELVLTLQKSKQAAKLIEKRVAAAAKTEENINKTRQSYAHVAFASSNLFFCISDLALLDPMYQYSLAWFNALFTRAMKEADKSLDVHVRTAAIEKHFLRVLYANVCRSLFEKDKLLFSFTLALRVMAGRGQVAQNEVRFFLTGGDPLREGQVVDNPTREDAAEDEDEEEEEEDRDEDEDDEEDKSKAATSDGTQDGVANEEAAADGHWLSDLQWHQLTQLALLPAFATLPAHIAANQHKWKALYDHPDPLARPFPAAFQPLSLFHKLLIARCFRPERVMTAIRSCVGGVLGREFISPPPFDLQAAYNDSNNCTPLIFVLSPGVDVASELLKLATEYGMGTPDKLFSISLGQGQGPLAEQAIREAVDKGSWVLLANCHLLQSWLPTLQRIIDELDPKTTSDKFRLWLTSMPCPAFPVGILQNGVKVTNEPPKGLRANLVQSYRSFDDKLMEGLAGRKADELRRFYFGLSMFHAVVQERRQYGPIGFNRHYEFTDSDLSISRTQLRQMLQSYPSVPYEALHYLIGQLNYGGRVTDDWDRRTLSAILADLIAPSTLSEELKLDSRGLYLVPGLAADVNEYRAMIADMPATDDSELFGFHQNVTITLARKEASQMLSTLLTLQPNTGGSGGQTRDEKISRLAGDMLDSLPPQFNIAAAQKKFPVSYSESMNTVLVQELIRFNKLTARVKQSLADIQKAIAGTVVMSSELEQTSTALYDNLVPPSWAAVAYPSMKPLAGWVSDLRRRLAMFSEWLDSGVQPTMYWLSGFFFTQSFLTGTMQNFARKHRIPIDECGFDFQVRHDISWPSQSSGPASAADVVHPPADGVYVYGMYLEGARWDVSKDELGDSRRGELFSEMPVIHLLPRRLRDMEAGERRLCYTCPVYKTSRRAGTLSTTGHSTNFVLAMQLPSGDEEKHWVKRGVALLTQLDD